MGLKGGSRGRSGNSFPWHWEIGGLQGEEVLRNERKGRDDLFFLGDGILDDESLIEKLGYICSSVTRAISSRCYAFRIGPVSLF